MLRVKPLKIKLDVKIILFGGGVIITSLFTWVKTTKNLNTHHTIHYKQAMGDGGEEELLFNRKMPKNLLS